MLGQLTLAAQGLKDAFTITGVDHPTRDGTGLRDYIHVWDLAQAHVAAVERFDEVVARAGETAPILNLGTGEGVTVRELVAAFEDVFGSKVPVCEAPPRPGGAVGAYAKVDRPRGSRVGSAAPAAGRHRLGPGLARKRKGILGYD